MAGFRIVFLGQPLSQRWQPQMERNLSRIARALSGGARDASRAIVSLGRSNIAQSGNFGIRWQYGLYADVEPRSGALVNTRIDIGHRMWFARIHEFGGVVRGRPLLWIPLSFAHDAKGIYARDYPGGLFRVNRGGGRRPLLLSRKDKQPKYFGIEQVTIPKRWNIRGIASTVMANFGSYYNRHLRS